MSFQQEKRFYGFFKCGDCGIRWESSQVYQRSNGAYWTQECKRCDKAWDPYKVEAIRCRICGNSGDGCKCTKEDKMERHVDPNKPHRSDLCTKCKAGRPCTGSM